MSTSKTKYIYWFAYYHLDSPSVRYRAKYPLEFFKKNYGIKSKLIIPGYQPRRMFVFIHQYFSALFFRKRNSIIVIQRVHSNFIYGRLLRVLLFFRKKNTIYDIDDADYLIFPPKYIYQLASQCSSIAAGSEKLKEHFSKFNKHCFHLTSPTVDLNLVKNNRNAIFTIGWIGNYAGDHKEKMIELIFPAALQLNFKCRFLFIGVTEPKDRISINAYFASNKNMELLFIDIPDWNDETTIQQQLIKIDLGIATLSDTPIQLAKSGIKVKQYLNNGIPVVSSDLPENNTYLKDKRNGFLCHTSDEFKMRIEQFYNMTDQEYSQFSDEARKSISNFNHTYFIETIEKNINF